MQLTSWNNTKLVPCHQSTLSTTSCPLGFSYDGAKSNINSDINNLIMIHTGGSNEWFIVSFIMSHFLCVSDSCLLDKSRMLWEGVHSAAGRALYSRAPLKQARWTCAVNSTWFELRRPWSRPLPQYCEKHRYQERV